MTLLLNLVGPSGIYQSSDYRLTDVSHGKSIEDTFGSKQLSFVCSTWRVHVSFTGTVQVGGRKTRDWILDALEKLQHPVTDKEAIGKIAERATAEFKKVPAAHRVLTIVAALDEGSEPARLFVLSCNEIPGEPPPVQPFEKFGVYEFSSSKPSALALGFSACVSKADMRFLNWLARGKMTADGTRKALARINARSAKESKRLVSEGCLVSSLTADGKRVSENFGRVPGVSADMPFAAEAAQAGSLARPVYIGSVGAKAQPGSPDLVIGPMGINVQNGFVGVRLVGDRRPLFIGNADGDTWKEKPNPRMQESDESEWYKRGLPVGEEREGFDLNSAGVLITLSGPDGSPMAEVKLQPSSGTLALRKNQIALAVLNGITVLLDGSFKHSGEPVESSFEIRADLSIAGAKPRSWTYTIDARVYPDRCEVSVRRMSVTLRRNNCQSPLLALSESEELAILAPRREVKLILTPANPSASANIEARFLLRDIIGVPA
jgi:hypothetical protein